MSDAEQQPRPARRLVERTIVALEHRGSAQSSDEVADWDAALGKICADADALDARYAALEAQLAEADEVMAGQVVRARAAYEQRIAELEAQLSAMEWVAKTHAEQSEAKSRRIAALEAQLAEAQAQLDAAIRLGIRQTGEMAALERLRAERWEPVADGTEVANEHALYYAKPEGNMLKVNKLYDGTFTVWLADHIRLCQRVTGAQPGEES